MKKILLTIVILLSSFSLFSSDLYIGGSFLAEYDYISRDTSSHYKTLNTDDNYYVDNIRSLGVGLNAQYFPLSSLPLGVNLGYKLTFPIGYQRGNVESGDNRDIETYVNRHFLAKHDIDIGVVYNFMMGESYGFFVEGGALIVLHTIPSHNNKNSRDEVIFSSFDEYGFYADLGLLLFHNNSYYKIGLTGNGILSNEDFGFSFALKVAGGYKFSL